MQSRTLSIQKFYPALVIALSSVIFSFSQAQHMFFHLLPGFVAPFTWVGLGGDVNWNNSANWSTGVVPGAGNTAIFDDICTANCNPTINVAINVGGVNMKSTYAGTITQGVGNTFTIGSAGWTQEAGTFTGSDANITFNAGVLNLSGTAVFNSTSAETYFNQTQAATVNTMTVTGGTTLTFPNSSTQRFRLQANCGGIVYHIVSPQKLSFYNVVTETLNVGCGSATFGNQTGTVEIRNDMTHASGPNLPLRWQGTIELYGNLSMASGAATGETWKIMGAVSKTYTGPGGVGNVSIMKTGGSSFTPSDAAQTFNMGNLSIQTGEFTFPQTLNLAWFGNSATHFAISPGTVVNVPVNSTVNMDSQGNCGPKDRTIDVDGSFNFEYLTISGSYTGCGTSSMWLAGGDSLTVKKDFTLGGDFSANFNIAVEGNFINTVQPLGTMAISLTTGSTTTASVAAAGFVSGTFSVNKPAATVTALTNWSFNNAGQDMNISSGTVNLSGRNLTVNDLLTIGASGRLLCNGGTVTAASWSVTGEVSCGNTIGITWTGLAGDNLWSTAGNWTNNTVPGAGDIAIFNGMCAGAQCNAQINSNLSVRGIILQNTYTGTLTQNASRTLTVGTAGYTQAGGTFAGGDAAVVMNGAFTLSGGTYTATSGTWTPSTNLTVSGSPTFNHNSGTLLFNRSSTSYVVTPGNVAYNNVTFGGWASPVNLNAGNMVVIGNLFLEDTYGGSADVTNGTIEAKGNITTSSQGRKGTALVRINGTGAQTLNGIAGLMLGVEINKPSGTLTLAGTITTYYQWIWLAGVIDATTSTLVLSSSGGGSSVNIVPGTTVYNNVTFGGYGATHGLGGGTMTVGGTLTFADTYGGTRDINNGTIEARGDVLIINQGKKGTVLVRINGTGSQTLTGASGTIPSVEINKPSGTLTLVGTITTNTDWIYTAGTIDAGTSTLHFTGSSSTGNVTPGSIQYNNVTFSGWATTTNLNSGTMIVTGTLTLADTYSDTTSNSRIISGTIRAQGNIILSNYGKGGTAVLKVDGTGAQSLTGSATGEVPVFEIDKPSGTLTLSNTINTRRNWTHTNGAVDSGTSTVVFLSSQTISPGTMIYNNVSFSGTSAVQSLNSGTMIVAGALTFNDSAAGSVNSGTIEARGNVTSTSPGKNGTAVLIMNGAVSGSLTFASGALLSTTIAVAKSGGSSVILQTNASFSTAGRDFTITSGTLDLNGYDFNVNDVLTVGIGATLKCNGGEFTAGTLTAGGTINCPGYSTYDFNWTGAGGNQNWNTAGNWQGGVAPGAGDVVVFEDTYCGVNCNALINANTSVRGMLLRSPYTGTITQGSGNTLTVGVRGYSQAAGTFTGSDANITVSLNSNSKSFSLTGGIFTSTSATLQAGFTASSGGLTSRDTFIVGAAATFNHNNGTARLTCYEAASGTTQCRINAASGVIFNHLSTYAYNGYGGGVGVTAGQTATVLGNMTIESGALLDLTTGYFDVHGDLNVQSTGGSINNKPAIVRLIGTGPQIYTANGTGCTVRLQVNKPSGSLTPGAADARLCSLNVVSGNFSAPTGTLYLGVPGHSIRASIDVLNLASPAQYIEQGGTVDFNSIDVWSGTLIYTIRTNGILNLTNVITRGVTGFTGGHTVAVGDKVVVLNQFEKASGRLGGNWELQGNSIFNGLSDATATFSFTGAVAQSISGASAGSGHWTINKTAGTVTLANSINLSKAGQNLTVTAGTLDMAGFNLTVANNISNSGTIQRGLNPTCGTITQGGSYSGNAAVCP